MDARASRRVTRLTGSAEIMMDSATFSRHNQRVAPTRRRRRFLHHVRIAVGIIANCMVMQRTNTCAADGARCDRTP